MYTTIRRFQWEPYAYRTYCSPDNAFRSTSGTLYEPDELEVPTVDTNENIFLWQIQTALLQYDITQSI